MKQFRDNAGRDWSISIDVNAVKQVRALASVDLLSFLDGDLINQLMSDPVKLVDVLYVVCKQQADAKSISDEDFGKAMGGDALEQATAALLDEIVGFFPSARRDLMRRAVEKVRAVETMAMSVAGDRLEEIDISALIQKALGNSSGNSPESLGLIPQL